jgi:hypothetical protein
MAAMQADVAVDASICHASLEDEMRYIMETIPIDRSKVTVSDAMRLESVPLLVATMMSDPLPPALPLHAEALHLYLSHYGTFHEERQRLNCPWFAERQPSSLAELMTPIMKLLRNPGTKLLSFGSYVSQHLLLVYFECICAKAYLECRSESPHSGSRSNGVCAYFVTRRYTPCLACIHLENALYRHSLRCAVRTLSRAGRNGRPRENCSDPHGSHISLGSCVHGDWKFRFPHSEVRQVSNILSHCPRGSSSIRR